MNPLWIVGGVAAGALLLATKGRHVAGGGGTQNGKGPGYTAAIAHPKSATNPLGYDEQVVAISGGQPPTFNPEATVGASHANGRWQTYEGYQFPADDPTAQAMGWHWLGFISNATTTGKTFWCNFPIGPQSDFAGSDWEFPSRVYPQGDPRGYKAPSLNPHSGPSMGDVTGFISSVAQKVGKALLA